MRHGFKQDPPAQALHFFEGGLELTPLRNRRPQPFVLFLRQSHADGFAFDFARPLVTGPPGPRSAILHIALADPTDPGQTLAQLRVLRLPGGGDFLWRWHEQKSSMVVNRAVYIPPYARYSFLSQLAFPARTARFSHRPGRAPGALPHPLPTGSLLRPLGALRALPQGHRPPKQPRPPLHPLAHVLVHALAGPQPRRFWPGGGAPAPGALRTGRWPPDFRGGWGLLPRQGAPPLERVSQGLGRHGSSGR